ncbi:hypothetical protein FGO68_gene8344 [Halteria grandinella]|uniref:EF-hand domain-containing protein n=1 Tax=Halteria grandinella TaxID=5974 RepID=A0A8J8SZK6_HALGN|nr:hypothetical protein FGO68_gene8344 [Halteria grandinella]
MGLRNSKEQVVTEILTLAQGRLTEQDIEEIMMNTQFNENELLKLYKKFLQLDSTGRGILTNREFLELPELKYTPFRPRLLDGFPLKTDEEIKSLRMVRQDDLRIEDLDGGKRRTIEDSKKDDDANNATNFPEERGKSKNGKVAPDGAAADEDLEYLKTEEDSPAFLKKLGVEPYIRFADYCKYLSLFNQRTGIDEKIQFYFRIFDVDGNKKVDEADLTSIMAMLFGTRMTEEDTRMLKDKIFEEADTGQKGYLDYEDMQKVLWATNLEHKCSMHFFES